MRPVARTGLSEAFSFSDAVLHSHPRRPFTFQPLAQNLAHRRGEYFDGGQEFALEGWLQKERVPKIPKCQKQTNVVVCSSPIFPLHSENKTEIALNTAVSTSGKMFRVFLDQWPG